jgi:hypothetical protein
MLPACRTQPDETASVNESRGEHRGRRADPEDEHPLQEIGTQVGQPSVDLRVERRKALLELQLDLAEPSIDVREPPVYLGEPPVDSRFDSFEGAIVELSELRTVRGIHVIDPLRKLGGGLFAKLLGESWRTLHDCRHCVLVEVSPTECKLADRKRDSKLARDVAFHCNDIDRIEHDHSIAVGRLLQR